MPLQLIGEDRRHLHAALIRAFPTISELDLFANNNLGLNIHQIIVIGALNHTMNELIRWYIAEDTLDDLVRAVFREKPHVAEMEEFYERLRLVPSNRPPRLTVDRSYRIEGDRKYTPLERWLGQLDPSVSTFRIIFEHVETLLDTALPPAASALNANVWWANNRGFVQAIAWLRAGWRVARIDLGYREVTFERLPANAQTLSPEQTEPTNSAGVSEDTETAPPPIGGGSYREERDRKYEPLARWLRQQDSELLTVQLTFAEVVAVVGTLPDSAYQGKSWWANDSTGHVQSITWLKAGWKVDHVDLEAREVTFRRTNAI